MPRMRLSLILVLFPCTVGGFAPPSTQPAADWPMFRGNTHLTGVAKSSLPARLDVLWRFEMGDIAESTAAIVDGVLYVGCDDGKLHALSLADGKPKWSFDTKISVKSSPTVHDGLVMFGDGDGVLHALDSRAGKEKWSFKTDAEIISSVNCHGDRIVFGSYDGFVYCLDRRDGKLQWKHETQGRVHGTPSIIEGRVLVAGCDERLHVVTLADGKIERQIEMGGVSGASAAVKGDQVFVGTFGNQVFCFNWRTGERVWMYENPDREFPFYSSAAVSDKLILIGGRDKVMHALDRETGKEAWAFNSQARVDSSPVVVGDRLFFGSGDGNLYELDLATGKERWRFDTGAGIAASAAVGEGCLVITADDGVVYCFGAKRD